MVKIVIATLLFVATSASAEIPAGARTYLPVLAAEQKAHWSDAPQPWTLAGLVEQESCITLTHKKCWNPHAELRTHREYGFGFGQITVAYHHDGTVRFNKFEELRVEHEELREWQWDKRHDPAMQLRAIVLMTRSIFGRFDGAADELSRWAFSLSAYNGGVSGVLKDQRLCANTDGCDNSQWFGHVEVTSFKSRTPQAAYRGQSWYSINREYVRNVLFVRRCKYESEWPEA